MKGVPIVLSYLSTLLLPHIKSVFIICSFLCRCTPRASSPPPPQLVPLSFLPLLSSRQQSLDIFYLFHHSSNKRLGFTAHAKPRLFMMAFIALVLGEMWVFFFCNDEIHLKSSWLEQRALLNRIMWRSSLQHYVLGQIICDFEFRTLVYSDILNIIPHHSQADSMFIGFIYCIFASALTNTTPFPLLILALVWRSQWYEWNLS